jgi:hypothetical protein
MKPPLVLLLVSFCMASMLTSCASSQVATFMFPGIQLVGPLTTEDVRQITELARHRPDIKKPIYQIYVMGPDRADVSGGKPQNTGDPVTGFKVRKDKGRWKIIDGSVYQTGVIITS